MEDQTATTPDAIARVRALLDEAAEILASVPEADDPGGFARADLMDAIDRVDDLASGRDPRRVTAI